MRAHPTARVSVAPIITQCAYLLPCSSSLHVQRFITCILAWIVGYIYASSRLGNLHAHHSTCAPHQGRWKTIRGEAAKACVYVRLPGSQIYPREQSAEISASSRERAQRLCGWKVKFTTISFHFENPVRSKGNAGKRFRSAGKSQVKPDNNSCVPRSEATTTSRTTNAGLKECFTTDVLPSSRWGKRLPLCAYRRLRGLIGHYTLTRQNRHVLLKVLNSTKRARKVVRPRPPQPPRFRRPCSCSLCDTPCMSLMRLHAQYYTTPLAKDDIYIIEPFSASRVHRV